MKEIYRELITPDGTVLVSRHVHDYVTHKDKNGKTYILDGGINSGYFRSSNHGDEVINTVVSTDNFEVVREKMFRWNPNTQKYTLLKDIDNDWLDNILKFYLPIPDEKRVKQIYDEYLVLYIQEKLYRAEKEYGNDM